MGTAINIIIPIILYQFGPDWPSSGEVDVIEYVNTAKDVRTALHTSPNCSMANVPSESFSGSWTTFDNAPQDNCDVKALGQDSNAGCSLFGPKNSVGSAFNEETLAASLLTIPPPQQNPTVPIFPLQSFLVFR